MNMNNTDDVNNINIKNGSDVSDVETPGSAFEGSSEESAVEKKPGAAGTDPEDEKPEDDTSPEGEEPEDADKDPGDEEPADDDTNPTGEKPQGEVHSDEFDLDALKSAYKKKHYLLFGADSYEPFIDTTGILRYLIACGFGDNGLKQAREQTERAAFIHSRITTDEEGAHYCDFCGDRLGAEYDVLNDGRERCYQCSRTVIKSVEELEKVFVEVIKNMEALFGISFYTAIDVKTVSAKKLARKIGIRFEPTPQYTGRVLGFAQNDKGQYHICVENQSPYLCSVATLSHELTHIWQYLNWNEHLLRRRYYPILKKRFPGISPQKIVYEGMAKWVEIQFLFLINEKDKAYREIIATLQRKDEYGIGLALYMDEYEFNEDTFINQATPFDDKKYPLHNIG